MILGSSCQKDLLPDQQGWLVDSRDNQKYQTIQIGQQIWMAENLNYITASESYCYNEEDGMCHIYGRLYTFTAATSACPENWHLPTDADWQELEAYLGMKTQDLVKIGWRSSGSVGKKLKSDEYWEGALNSSGFNATPAGTGTTTFQSLGRYTYFWTATDENLGWYAYGRSLYHGDDGVGRDIWWKSDGLSVRCLKNSPGNIFFPIQ